MNINAETFSLIRKLTTASEFSTSAVRALADGHAPNSAHTLETILWAIGELREVLEAVGMRVDLAVTASAEPSRRLSSAIGKAAANGAA
jgi:hypothetical protein